MIRPLAVAWIGINLLGAMGRLMAADLRAEGFRIAPGWKAEVAAAEPLVINPVTMAFGPDGRLFVLEWMAGRGPNDRIRALRDADGDGTFDEVSTFMEDLELPAGLMFWDGWSYLTLGHDVVRLRDEDGDGRWERREVIASGFPHNDSHHRVSGMAIGPDGWLYLSAADGDIGARGSDGSEASILRSGGIFRCRADGSRLEVFALGMRNPWGNVAFDDEGRMLHTDNDSESTPEFTGCRLLHVVEGGDYGWRVRDGSRCCIPDPERSTWDGGRPGRLGSILETGRGAPTGLCILNSEAFPDAYRNLVIYPDVFRKTVRAYKLRPDRASFAVAEETEVLASDDGLFRPSDAEMGPDGALYVLDWRTDSGGASQLAGNGVGGRIYRLTWAGTEAEPARPTYPPGRFVGIEAVSDATLLDGLAGDEPGRRAASARELARRVASSDGAARRIWAAASPWIADAKRPLAARAALIHLAGGMRPGRGAPPINPTKFPEPGLRRQAYDAIRPGEPGPVVPTAAIRAAMLKAGETDPGIARAQAMALGRAGGDHPGGEPAIAAKLLAMAIALRNAGPIAREGPARGLERLGMAGLEATAAWVEDPNATRRNVARDILQGWRGEVGASEILAVATSAREMPAATRSNLFLALREFVEAVPPGPVADWLVAQPEADEAARVEAIRLLAAMGDRARPAADAVIVDLLEEDGAPTRLAAMAMAGAIRPASARGPLLAAVADRTRATAERARALAALRGDKDRTLLPLVQGLLADEPDPGLRGEALRMLGSLDFVAASAAARALLADPDADLRADAISLLGQKPGSALKLIRACQAGAVHPADIPRAIEVARRHSDPNLRDALAALQRDRLHRPEGTADLARLEDQVRRSGNPDRGKRLYLDPARANCASCHRMEGVGGSVGPDLTRVWETMTFARKVESIIEPSREIKEGYGSIRVETGDGRLVAGILVSDAGGGITVRDARGQETTVPAAEVERSEPDPTSLMPEGITSSWTHEELLDLLAFLGDRRAQESLRVDPASRP